MILMTQTEALDVVANYGKQHNLVGTLETMIQMRDFYRDLTEVEREGFNVAFAGFNRLFNGDANRYDRGL